MKRNEPLNPTCCDSNKPIMSNYVFDVFNGLLEKMLKNLKAKKAAIVFFSEGKLTIEALAEYSHQKGVILKSAYQLKAEINLPTILPESVLLKVLESNGQIFIQNEEALKEIVEIGDGGTQLPRSIFCSVVYTAPDIQALLYIENLSDHFQSKEELDTLLMLWKDQVYLSFENMRKLSHFQERLKNRMDEVSAAKKKNLANIRFLADMNHEVMAPLNSIVGFSQLLMKKGNQLQFPEEVKRYIGNIHKSGNRLAELMDNVLNFSRIETNVSELVKESINLKLLLRSVLLANRQLSEERAISLMIDLQDGFPNVTFNVRSVLTNVLTSIMRFCVIRSPHNLKISLNGRLDDRNIRFFINDNGNRLSNKELENLFHPLIEPKGQCSKGISDYNLSFAQLKKMVESVKGSITYSQNNEERPGFQITVPHIIQQNKDEMVDIISVKKSELQGTTAILVQDHMSDWKSLQEILKELGVKTILMPLSREKSESINEIAPDFIFIDIHMPGMDEKAITLINFLRNIHSLNNITIVAVSADKFHNRDQMKIGWENVEYVAKPYGFGEIYNIISKNTKKDQTGKETQVVESGSVNTAKILDSYKVFNQTHGKRLIRDLEEMKQIPIYKGGTIINRINRMTGEGQLSLNNDSDLIINLKSAVFEGSTERYKSTIENAIKKITHNL